MISRPNPNIIPDLLYTLGNVQQDQQTTTEEIATGRSVNNLSDNPAVAAMIVNNNALSSQNDQFLANVSDLQSKFQVGDSALSSAIQLMTTAISVGTEGANGTLSVSERQALGAQITGIQQQMLSLANTSYQGTYLFSGTVVTTQPFAEDASSPSGVSYGGNSGVTSVEISTGQSMKTNVPGDQVFTNSSGNVFQALNDLANALNSGNGIEAANTEVQQAFNELNTQRVFYGNALSQVQSQESFLNQDQVNLSQQQTDLAGVNMAQAISNSSQEQIAQEALLNVTGQVLNLPTLLNYLK